MWACSGRKNCPSGNPRQAGARLHRSAWSCRSRPFRRSRNADHPAVGGHAVAGQHPRQLALAAGEAGDVTRQRPGRRGRSPGLPSYGAASTSPAGALPRAAATNSERTGSARPSAPASRERGVLTGGAVDAPLQVTDRPRLRPAASASSSWVSLAPARNWRSNPANPSTGCSAMTPASLPQALARRTVARHRAGRTYAKSTKGACLQLSGLRIL